MTKSVDAVLSQVVHRSRHHGIMDTLYAITTEFPGLLGMAQRAASITSSVTGHDWITRVITRPEEAPTSIGWIDGRRGPKIGYCIVGRGTSPRPKDLD